VRAVEQPRLGAVTTQLVEHNSLSVVPGTTIKGSDRVPIEKNVWHGNAAEHTQAAADHRGIIIGESVVADCLIDPVRLVRGLCTGGRQQRRPNFDPAKAKGGRVHCSVLQRDDERVS
jgi:hypothetical protein